MNKQRNLIQKIMFYDFKLNHNTVEATKNISYAKGEDVVDYRMVNR